MRTSSLLTVAGALVLASGCLVTTTSGRGAPPPPPPHHHEGGPPPRPMERSLEGTVTDAVTGAPLNKAMVDLVDRQSKVMSAQAGPDGRYRFNTLPPGEFAIRCRLSGYEPWDQGYTAFQGPSHVDCRLQPKRR